MTLPPLDGREKTTASTPALLFTLLAWIAYLVAVGVLATRSAPLAGLAVLTAGGWLFTGLAYFRHELWHSYFPGIPNPLAYRLVSCVLFSDPQVYGLCHASHHKHVHTDRDLEFFCEDYATDRSRRKWQYLLELLLGNMAWEITTVLRLRRSGKLDVPRARLSLLMRLGFQGAIALVAERIQPGGGVAALLVFLATAWWGALLTRHNQWVEHLGLRANEAPLLERNMLTRALPSRGLVATLFNLMNHNDAKDHVLHHLHPGMDTRDRGFPLPAGAPTITPSEYLRLLATHWRDL